MTRQESASFKAIATLFHSQILRCSLKNKSASRLYKGQNCTKNWFVLAFGRDSYSTSYILCTKTYLSFPSLPLSSPHSLLLHCTIYLSSFFLCSVSLVWVHHCTLSLSLSLFPPPSPSLSPSPRSLTLSLFLSLFLSSFLSLSSPQCTLTQFFLFKLKILRCIQTCFIFKKSHLSRC